MWPEAVAMLWPQTAPARADGFQAHTVAGIGAVDRIGWTAAHPHTSEGWAYLRACEMAPPPAMALSAVSVRDAGGFAGAAPLFSLRYRLDTPIQGGPLAKLGDVLAKQLPRLMEWRMLGVGSPFADRCPIALRPGLPQGTRGQVITALIAETEAEARRQRAGLVVFKDLSVPEAHEMSAALAAMNYFAVESLPLAVLDLGGTADMDGYLAGLSRQTRKDLRRKMKGAGAVEVEQRSSIVGMESEIRALYEETRAQSRLRYGDFEDLPDAYFERVSQALGDQAVFMCYRVGGILAAFNLLLLEADRVIDKFLGMRYPLAREHDLYAVSWMNNVRFCQQTGRRYLQSGQTAYASKLRFGSDLVPCVHMVKHRNPLIHAALRLAAPVLAFPRWDPDLRMFRQRARA